MKIREDLISVSEQLQRLVIFARAFDTNNLEHWSHLKNREDFKDVYKLDKDQRKPLEEIYKVGRDIAVFMSSHLTAFNQADRYPSLTLYIDSFKDGWIEEIEDLRMFSNKTDKIAKNLAQCPWAVSQMINLFNKQLVMLDTIKHTLNILKETDLYKSENGSLTVKNNNEGAIYNIPHNSGDINISSKNKSSKVLSLFKYKKIEWENHPKNIFSWFLWAIPKVLWRPVIIVFVCFAVYGALQIAQKDSIELTNLKDEINSKKKMKIWENSDEPEFREELFKTLIKPDDIPLKIWKSLFLKENDIKVLIAMASNPSIPKNFLNYRKITQHESVRVRLAGILNTNQKKKAIRLLANEDNIGVLDVVALNENTPPNILVDLARRKEKTILESIAANNNTPTSILNHLSNCDQLDIVKNVAGNNNTPPNTLRYIIENMRKDISKEIQFAIIRNILKNSNTPDDVYKKLIENSLKRMSKDNKALLLLDIMYTSKCTNEVFKILIEYKEYYIFNHIVNNPKTPHSIIRNMVKYLVKLTPKNVEYSILYNIASSLNTPIDVLKDLSKSNNIDILKNIAGNIKTPINILRTLSRSKNVSILENIASNSNSPIDLFRKLAESNDMKVLRGISNNTKAPNYVIRKLAKSKNTGILINIAQNPQTPIDVLLELAESKEYDILSSIAENLKTPVDILEKLFKSKRLDIVEEIINNPNTPISILKKLILIDDKNFREEALLQLLNRSESEWQKNI